MNPSNPFIMSATSSGSTVVSSQSTKADIQQVLVTHNAGDINVTGQNVSQIGNPNELFVYQTVDGNSVAAEGMDTLVAHLQQGGILAIVTSTDGVPMFAPGINANSLETWSSVNLGSQALRVQPLNAGVVNSVGSLTQNALSKVDVDSAGDSLRYTLQLPVVSSQLHSVVSEISNVQQDTTDTAKRRRTTSKMAPVRNNDLMLRCTYCDQVFSSPPALSRHLAQHSQVYAESEGRLNTVDEGQAETLSSGGGTAGHRCTQCGASFSQLRLLQQHMRTHELLNPNIDPQISVGSTDSSPSECRNCKVRFSTLTRLRAHMRTHQAERPYKCQFCEAAFTWQTSQKLHMRIHTGQKPYKCEQCDAAFASSSYLKAHVRRAHTGEKPYCCQFCEARFADWGNMRKHQKTHSKNTSYSCQLCSQTFNWARHLKMHMSTAHPSSTQYSPALVKTRAASPRATESDASASIDVASLATAVANARAIANASGPLKMERTSQPPLLQPRPVKSNIFMQNQLLSSQKCIASSQQGISHLLTSQPLVSHEKNPLSIIPVSITSAHLFSDRAD